MEPIILVVLATLGVPIALAIWLVRRAMQATERMEEHSLRLTVLEAEISRLKPQGKQAASSEAVPERAKPVERPSHALEAPDIAPPLLAPALPPVAASLPVSAILLTPPAPPAPPVETAPAINWEHFMGVKLFAWLGGLALFLGVAFFVKYSFDNNLVSPELRVATGFLAGTGLLMGGVLMSRRNFPALSQTLCATGVVILYAVTFACRSIYHFNFFGPLPTFLLMMLITATAFLLAVRLDALVVAILGMLGGFLTPMLLSTGQDNPGGLFGYVAILDFGLIVVSFHRRWSFLGALAALGTALMQGGWAMKFFESGKYFEGNKILIPLVVLAGFCGLFLAAAWRAKGGKRSVEEEPFLEKEAGAPTGWYSGSTLGLAAVALVFTAWFLDYPPLAHRPWLIFSFLFLIDVMVMVAAEIDERMSLSRAVAGFAVFGLLGYWTEHSLDNDLLDAGLAFYFVFAIVHSVAPVVLARRRGMPAPAGAGQLFPIMALALVLVPVMRMAEVSFIVWPFILLVDLLAIGLAVLTATLLPVLAVLFLTLTAAGALIFKIPSDLTGLPVTLFLLGTFAVFFVVVSGWLLKKFKTMAGVGNRLGDGWAAPEQCAAILPGCSIALPFLLLIMATLRLPLVNPSPVFGLALMLLVLLLGVTKLFSMEWMPALGLGCVAGLECAWHFNRFAPSNPHQPLGLILGWYLIFFAVFAAFPFLFLRQFADKTGPWAAAALAGPAQFFLAHRFVAAVHPTQMMGLLPAAFALPGLASLVVILKNVPAGNRSRLSQLAWFGGVALFFITLIFPIQFDRQWITIGWALEGAALLWLFHRVPHTGLRLAGFGLLVAGFVRLAFNPAVLEYHPRAAAAIFNWYLYAYGVVTVCLFAGAKLLAPPRHLILNSNARGILAALGTVLSFILLNIEIADYFSRPGATLTFEFSGSFARDMSYSIGWALFALVLLLAGILKGVPAARYAATGLLGVTLLKLFFHDLARIGQLYRIGALIGVAIIAMVASFAYQKFFTAASRRGES